MFTPISFQSHKTLFRLPKDFAALLILALISASKLPEESTILPKYWNSSATSITSWRLNCISLNWHFKTILGPAPRKQDFLALITIPILRNILSAKCTHSSNTSIESHITTISSAYSKSNSNNSFSILRLLPTNLDSSVLKTILTPLPEKWLSTILTSASRKRLNKTGAKTSPCLTPFSTLKSLEKQPSIRTTPVVPAWKTYIHRYIIHLLNLESWICPHLRSVIVEPLGKTLGSTITMSISHLSRNACVWWDHPVCGRTVHTHTQMIYPGTICWQHKYSSFYRMPLHQLPLCIALATPFYPDITCTSLPSVQLPAGLLISGLSTSSSSHGMASSSSALQTTSSLAGSHHPCVPDGSATATSCSWWCLGWTNPCQTCLLGSLMWASAPTAHTWWHLGWSSHNDCERWTAASHAWPSKSMPLPHTSKLPALLPCTLLFWLVLRG